MKKIFNEKGSMIAKAIIFQIAMSIFGCMITMSIIAIDEGWLLLGGIFSILFYFSLIGAAINEDGAKDHLKISAGRMEPDALLGFKYILISYIPTFLITILFVILNLFGLENSLTQIMAILIRLFLSGMYQGLDRVIFASGDTLAKFSLYCFSFVIYQVISVVVCGLFYYIGYKGINLTSGKKKEK